MKSLVRVATLAIVTVAVVLLSACSSGLHLNQELDDRDDIRQTYLQNNPNGKYNEHIAKGEVVKGMSVIEVLAAWGLPGVRRTSTQTGTEFWTYYTLDDISQKISSYDLVFTNRTLDRWIVAIDVMSLEDFHENEATEGTGIAYRPSGGLSGDAGSLGRP